MSRPLVLLIAGLVAAPLMAAATPLDAELQVRLDPPVITVGDRVWATFEVTTDAASPEPAFPDFPAGWGKAEILAREPIQREEAGVDRVRYRQRFALTAFEPGRLALPVTHLTIGGERLATPGDLALTVESVLPTEAGAEVTPPPRPPQPPRPLPVGATFWWSFGGGLALLAAALLFVALRPRRPATTSAPGLPDLPPWPELLAGLARAEAAGDPEAGHVALSSALRRYLGRSFSFPGLESTSREISRELAGRRAPQGAAARVREVLVACDGVKFAKARAQATDLAARLAAARDAAAEIEAHLAPAPPPGAPLADGRS